VTPLIYSVMLTNMCTCRKLIFRWMWNVNAVMEWAASQDSGDERPKWWKQSEETLTESTGQAPDLSPSRRFKDRILEFEGQGRQIG